jgi:hypothetical protein
MDKDCSTRYAAANSYPVETPLVKVRNIPNNATFERMMNVKYEKNK